MLAPTSVFDGTGDRRYYYCLPTVRKQIDTVLKITIVIYAGWGWNVKMAREVGRQGILQEDIACLVFVQIEHHGKWRDGVSCEDILWQTAAEHLLRLDASCINSLLSFL